LKASNVRGSARLPTLCCLFGTIRCRFKFDGCPANATPGGAAEVRSRIVTRRGGTLAALIRFGAEAAAPPQFRFEADKISPECDLPHISQRRERDTDKPSPAWAPGFKTNPFAAPRAGDAGRRARPHFRPNGPTLPSIARYGFPPATAPARHEIS
jgi:hypothetical protein